MPTGCRRRGERALRAVSRPRENPGQTPRRRSDGDPAGARRDARAADGNRLPVSGTRPISARARVYWTLKSSGVRRSPSSTAESPPWTAGPRLTLDTTWRDAGTKRPSPSASRTGGWRPRAVVLDRSSRATRRRPLIDSAAPQSFWEGAERPMAPPPGQAPSAVDAYFTHSTGSRRPGHRRCRGAGSLTAAGRLRRRRAP